MNGKYLFIGIETLQKNYLDSVSCVRQCCGLVESFHFALLFQSSLRGTNLLIT